MPPTTISLNHHTSDFKYKFPYEILNVDEDTNRKLLQDFKGETTGFVQVGPKKYFMPIKYRQDAENIYNFKPRPDDVWVVTFPRSGTTWTQEMVWMIANDFNYKEAAEIPLLLRFPFFEYSTMVHKDIKAMFMEENSPDQEKMNIVQNMDIPMWQEFDKMTGRRFIKTHLPFSLLPPDLLTCGCKVIYVARNPKDVSISYYYLNKSMRTLGYINDWPTYWKYFENGLLNWSPYWDHIREGWDKRHEQNLLFLFYEDMNKNLNCAIKQMAAFLDKPINNEELNALKEHLDIKNFRNNPSVNFDLLNQIGVIAKGEQGFIRQGKSGNWKGTFDEELNSRADKWIEANIGDIEFPMIK